MQDQAPGHNATLSELTALAMDVARTLHARITAPETEAQALPPLAAAFDRAARCVRRCVLLADHLARPQTAATPGRTHARQAVIRAVEDRILTADPRPENPDALRRELLERIEDPAFDADLAATPLPDLIETLARDLGVSRFQGLLGWPRRTPADIARLHNQAEGTHDPAQPAWTHSAPPPRPSPNPPGRRGPDGLTDDDRALHAQVMALGRRRPA